MADHEPRPTRRILFHGLGALGIAVALAGCGSDNTGSTEPAPDQSGGSGSGSGSGSAGTELAKTSQVPVGGGVILTEQNVVVTQPTKGTFECFSAICTHAGCQVASVAAGTINCPCHGSQFSVQDGSNVVGPAGLPAGSIPALGKVAVKVQGGNVVEG